jgi:uncharacterized protein (TIGR03032 family)
VLEQLNGSLLLSTHTTGNIVVLSAARQKLTVSFQPFERPMGMAVRPGWLLVGTRTQVWSLRNAPEVAARLESLGRYDACYLPRFSHFTGNINCHELAWLEPSLLGGTSAPHKPELCIVNTLFSCLCTVHAAFNFVPRWKPAFVTDLLPEDRCHLNGVAVAGGKPRFATALAETDRAQGWRTMKAGGGCVIDVASNETVCRGLTMPHSPRLAGNRLLVLHSGLGELVTVEPASGRWETIAALPGYTRGLAIQGTLALVGLSKVRAGSSQDGVPIAARPEQLKCGFAVVDLNTGRVLADFEFVSGIDELFDIQVLPGVCSPFLAGPFADRVSRRQVWAVPPDFDRLDLR